jgi:hypothetical protein
MSHTRRSAAGELKGVDYSEEELAELYGDLWQDEGADEDDEPKPKCKKNKQQKKAQNGRRCFFTKAEKREGYYAETVSDQSKQTLERRLKRAPEAITAIKYRGKNGTVLCPT